MSSPRILTSHKVNGCNEQIEITATDEPGPGGANHEYQFDLPPTLMGAYRLSQNIKFQNGAIAESGVNGITHEALLAIIIDRLQSFQRGPYACRENALALTKCEEAIMWLNARTNARIKRGVEGTMTV